MLLRKPFEFLKIPAHTGQWTNGMKKLALLRRAGSTLLILPVDLGTALFDQDTQMKTYVLMLISIDFLTFSLYCFSPPTPPPP